MDTQPPPWLIPLSVRRLSPPPMTNNCAAGWSRRSVDCSTANRHRAVPHDRPWDTRRSSITSKGVPRWKRPSIRSNGTRDDSPANRPRGSATSRNAGKWRSTGRKVRENWSSVWPQADTPNKKRAGPTPSVEPALVRSNANQASFFFFFFFLPFFFLGNLAFCSAVRISTNLALAAFWTS